MKYKLISLVLSMLFTSVALATDEKAPVQTPTTNSSPTPAPTTTEPTNMLDYCRTHTC